MARLSLVFAALVSCSAWADGPRKLTNIDYLGCGYNVVLGDPHSDDDSGFQQFVFSMKNYSKGNTTGDGRFLLPNDVEALREVSCDYDAEVNEVRGSMSMFQSLSQDVSAHGGLPGFSFSASASSQRVRNDTRAYHTMYSTATAKCVIYSAFLAVGLQWQVADGFSGSVAALPATADPAQHDNEYYKFIGSFGTHASVQVLMGAKAVRIFKFTEVQRTSFQASSFDTKAAAKFSFLGFTGGASGETQQQRQMASTYESKSLEHHEHYVGSRPSVDGKWDTWARTTSEDPVPMSYTLQQLDSFLTSAFFPGDAQIASKQATLAKHLAAYCGTVPGCSSPMPDPPEVGYLAKSSRIQGTETLQCDAGHVALSCGMMQDNTPPGEKLWKTWQSGVDVCTCYNYFGAVCHANCVNAPIVRDLEVVVGAMASESVARCPAGKQLLSCGVQLLEAPFAPRAYPSSENACTCAGGAQVTCFGTCASNIVNHQIVKVQGADGVIASCNDGQFLLGCGAEFSGAEPYPGYWPNDMHSCTCYDHFGVSCYAICGVFDHSSSASYAFVNGSTAPAISTSTQAEVFV